MFAHCWQPSHTWDMSTVVCLTSPIREKTSQFQWAWSDFIYLAKSSKWQNLTDKEETEGDKCLPSGQTMPVFVTQNGRRDSSGADVIQSPRLPSVQFSYRGEQAAGL